MKSQIFLYAIFAISPLTTLKADEITCKSHEEFTLGNYSYKITKVQIATSIGNEFAHKEVDEGAKFVVVDYAIRNNTKATQEVMASDLKLRDAQQRLFDPDSGCTFYVKQDFVISQLQPGIFKPTEIVFEVPDDALADIFQILVPEKGFGPDTAVIAQITAEAKALLTKKNAAVKAAAEKAYRETTKKSSNSPAQAAAESM